MFVIRTAGANQRNIPQSVLSINHLCSDEITSENGKSRAELKTLNRFNKIWGNKQVQITSLEGDLISHDEKVQDYVIQWPY